MVNYRTGEKLSDELRGRIAAFEAGGGGVRA